jgi:NAD(P)-dependent dehydrogenase (short-subunit alcohol dehydrogenase family)
MSKRLGAFVVTGAGSGIGKAISAKLLSEGHHVYGLGRDPKKLLATSKLVSDGRFTFSSVDLSRADESARTTQEIRRWLKQMGHPLLGVVNNAGVFDRLPFVKTSDAIWEKSFSNNLMSAVRITREFHQDLKEAKPSSVLNISSTLGMRAIRDTLAYSTMKAAMINWTQGLALEWAADGIRVNFICPGIVDTPIHAFHSQAEDAKKELHTLQPLGRLGTSEDIAESAWFLLSESSSWTTGAVLSVDGGIHL